MRISDWSSDVCSSDLLVDLDVIRKAYENAARRVQGSASRIDGTRMQREFIELVRRAAEINASDIHVTVDRYEAAIRVRVDGVMTRLGELPAGHADRKSTRLNSSH